jgi:hypothetical protein
VTAISLSNISGVFAGDFSAIELKGLNPQRPLLGWLREVHD